MLKALARLFGSPRPRTPPTASPAPAPDAGMLLQAPIAALERGESDEAIALLDALTDAHPELADAHLLLGTVLQRERRYDDARDCYLLAACFRPDWWAPHAQLGLLALDRERHPEAVASLARAVELGAQDARVHHALGKTCLHTGDVKRAVEAFRRALEIEPDFAAAHSDLGYTLFRELEDYDEATRHISRALELAPDDLSALCNWIMVLDSRADTEGALRLADDLLARAPELVEARVNRALMLLKQGEFAKGWDEYEARKRLPRNTCTSAAPWPEADAASLRERVVFVYGEQGLGDEIMFASCLPDLAATARACVIECNPRLAGLFARSFPAMTLVPKEAWRADPSAIVPRPECKIAMGSLPARYRRSLAQFPQHGGYLCADPVRAAHWMQRLATLPGRSKVGISWRGGMATSRSTLRSIPLAQWLAVLQVPGIDFVSLQYSDVRSDLDALEGTGVKVHHWQEAIDDYEDTAALVSVLDLVVSVQTAVVHLAGALGRPAWALIPAAPEWRYGARGSVMPWYPSVRLIRQSGAHAWAPVMEGVAADLLTWARAGSR